MTNTGEHEQWLEKQVVEDRAKQDAFMNKIASKLGRARVTAKPEHPFRGSPDFWRAYEWPLEERVERFTANFLAGGGHVARLADWAAVKQFIADKTAETGAKHVIRQEQPELDELQLEQALADTSVRVWNSDPVEDWRARAAESDIGIVVADYAAAYTGSITVLSAKEKGRSVSLLPTILIAVIPIDRLKTRLGEILVEFDRAGREQLPAGIHFISGPSRSSDIENDLTIGVHGPGIVYALIVG